MRQLQYIIVGMQANHYLKSAWLTICLLLLLISAKGQYATGGLDLDNDLYSWYDQSLGLENTDIVRGAYQKIDRFPFSSPFFEEESWDINKVSYRGMVFDSVYLIYDIENDNLLIRHPTEYKYFSNPIRLNREQIEWFTVNDHFFRFYSERIFSFQPGFYEELFTGEHIDFLIKHIKNLETKDQRDLIYEKEEVYIINYMGEFTHLRGRGSFLRLFNDNKGLKKKLKQFIKINGLRIRKGYDSDLLVLAEFFENELVE